MNITQTFYDDLAPQYHKLFLSNGCRKVTWRFPEETGFYQPIIVVRK